MTFHHLGITLKQLRYCTCWSLSLVCILFVSGGGWCDTHVVLINNILFLQHIHQLGMERQKRHVLAPFDRDTRIVANVLEHGVVHIDVTYSETS